ncbi:tRNA-dependent cyclodipeptide synthase [Streptomyces triticirhizae]|uniref:Cyclodipeptide synthase n=1 Tax=Streptomyces triticirhizae TaxID=2483353 RepID=A0A3M2M073_9ACTN|nr:tRNA-dependent cyclodipeptide synthase [Streptomyces triticirhizae]RMI42886.1 tRNA-dependent cyclodipeptide synthase [Streptomyces triticirhizae]
MAAHGDATGGADRNGPGAANRPRLHRRSFVVEPFSEACGAVWELRQHVVFGVSPGNSYFNEARLAVLLDWLRAEFARVDVVVPDSALEHTYLALDYDARRAARKARAETNVLHNRVTRAWDSVGGRRAGDGLHRMSELVPHPVYRERLVECEEALAEDEVLWDTCAEMSREVLTLKGFEGPFTTERLRRAVRYLLAELPFFLASAEIFGAPTSLNFYHRPLPLAELVFSGKSLLRPGPGQGYATVRPVQSA